MSKLLLISAVLLLIGCSGEPTSTGEMIDIFDTEAYLTAEFDGQSARDITKTISYNDDKETIAVKAYNLEDDIDVLKQSNISKPSWADKYTVDTLNMDNGRKDIVYTSVDPRLQIKKLIVSQKDNRILGFEAFQERDALISTSSKRISYTSDDGYHISTTSKDLISPERTIAIDVRF